MLGAVLHIGTHLPSDETVVDSFPVLSGAYEHGDVLLDGLDVRLIRLEEVISAVGYEFRFVPVQLEAHLSRQYEDLHPGAVRMMWKAKSLWQLEGTRKDVVLVPQSACFDVETRKLLECPLLIIGSRDIRYAWLSLEWGASYSPGRFAGSVFEAPGGRSVATDQL